MPQKDQTLQSSTYTRHNSSRNGIPQEKNWAGYQFGDLTVVRFVEKNGESYSWLCQCICGYESIVDFSEKDVVYSVGEYICNERKTYASRSKKSRRESAEFLKKQEYKCGICSREFSNSVHPNIDHDHRSGKIRGVLCKPCNTGLGMLKDSTEYLGNAIKYLINSQN